MEVLRGICAKWETIIGKTSYIHSARHAYTTLLKSKYKCSDEFVKTVVRWSSIDLVSTYNDMSEDEIEWEEVENIKNMINKDKNKSKSEYNEYRRRVFCFFVLVCEASRSAGSVGAETH